MTHRSTKHDKAAGESLVRNMVRTRIPTRHGEFMLYYYENKRENKEHLALVKGDVEGALDVPVRVHSECLTGDVFGSMRCDCGDQLDRALRVIGSSECGVLLYLRQEGRGIGLLKKLQAYNLQDQGLDTVEANLRLGHREDERDYGIAAAILKDLKLHSVRLITNNPRKIGELRELGVDVTERIPIEIPFNPENEGYLRTKARKMQHLLSLKLKEGDCGEFAFLEPLLERLAAHRQAGSARPFVTLSFVQNLIGAVPSSPAHSARALRLKRFLRGRHDALLLGIESVWQGSGCKAGALADEQLVIVDEGLRCAEDVKWLEMAGKKPVILTAAVDGERSARLTAHGAKVLSVGRQGVIDMDAALDGLAELGLKSMMVEGDGSMVTRLLPRQLVDYCVITVIPELTGRFGPALETRQAEGQPQLFIGNCHYHTLDNDIIIHGVPDRL